MKPLYVLMPLVLVAVLAGCASPPQSHYYTLVPSAGQLAGMADSGTVSVRSLGPGTDNTPAAKAKTYAISVQPVRLPEQVDRAQIVLSEHNSARVVPLNQSLWVSPLDDEIRRALSTELSARLNVPDVSGNAVPKGLAVWQVYVTVSRFDSVFDSRAILDATWHLNSVNKAGKNSRICSARISVSVGNGVPALVDGQRKAVHKLAGLIAAQLSGHGLTHAADATVTLKGCV